MRWEDVTPDTLKTADSDRRRRYTEYLTFIGGRSGQWTDYRTGSAPTFDRSKRVTLNYARRIIRQGVSYLLQGAQIDFDHDRETTAERALDVWEAIREYNDLDALDIETETDCSILGDACYYVRWHDQDRQVEIVSLDPQRLWAWGRAGIHRPDIVAFQWDQEDVLHTQVWDAKRVRQFTQGGETQEFTNPYGVLPFILIPNERRFGELWGISDLEDAIPAYQELNRAITQLSQVMALSGNPIAVLSGITDSEDIAVQPGSVWELPPEARAELLNLLAGGVATQHIEYFKTVLSAVHDITEVPRSAFGDTTSSGALSALALQLLLEPLVHRTRRKRALRRHAYIDRARLAMQIASKKGRKIPADIRIETAWGNILPVDNAQVVRDEQTAVFGRFHSRKRAMRNTGVLDTDDEWGQILSEEKELLPLGRPTPIPQAPHGEETNV